MRKRKILVVFLLIFSVLLTSFTFYAYQVVYTPNVLVGKQKRVLIIKPGATHKSLMNQLHDGDYVQDIQSFALLARLMGYDKQIKPGRYILEPEMTNIQAIRMLRAGIQEPVDITFNNVRLIDQLAEKITNNLLIDEEAFNAALANYIAQNEEGFNEQNVIGMFIPNTYEVYYNISAKDLIDRMEREYKRFWNESRLAKADSLGLTPKEVSTLASIVQAESIKRDESATIAGLYINRLQRGIALQADPTLVFASGDFSLKRVLNEHKEIDSPYNTYLNTGLPPGPINMPTIHSIDAVLNYEDHNYIYMCAKEDFSGYHNFATNYRDHLNNANRYQRALTIEQRKARQLNQ